MAHRNRPFLSNVVARLVAYYGFWIAVTGGIYRFFPMIPRYIAEERGRHIRTVSGVVGVDIPDIPGPIDVGIGALVQPELVIPVASAMIYSFLLAVPVAWVYTWSRAQRRTVHGFAQTLVIVPLAISVVVFLVKGSLPLAFSLAGIVAAVRFRSNLEEPGDGVYLFMVIGIGLSAGVQLLSVALIGSMFFVAAQLVVGRTKVLRDDVVMIGWHLEKVAPLDAEAGPEDPREATIRIRTTDLAQALGAIAPILEAHTAIYHHVLEESDDPGVIVVRFDVRLLKKVKLKNVVRSIEAAEITCITNIEANLA